LNLEFEYRNFQSPTSNLQLPISNFQFQISNFQIPVLVPYQRNKLLPRFVVMEEFAGEGAGGSAGVLFAHTAHLHAQVMTLEYYSYTQRL
jgi:hypothetical protein